MPSKLQIVKEMAAQEALSITSNTERYCLCETLSRLLVLTVFIQCHTFIAKILSTFFFLKQIKEPHCLLSS